MLVTIIICFVVSIIFFFAGLLFFISGFFTKHDDAEYKIAGVLFIIGLVLSEVSNYLQFVYS